MVKHVKLTNLRRKDVQSESLRKFKPKIIDKSYLKDLNVKVKPTMEVLNELQKGSTAFAKKFADKSLVAELSCQLKDISMSEPLKSHRYTSKCPIDVLDINPVVGCNKNCLYCLVTDGDHSGAKTVYKNYGSFLKQKLSEENGAGYSYYFASQTEPFQEATLQTGIAHDILREFINFFKSNPSSESSVFILSKAGKEELKYKKNGDTILDLMSELSDRLSYNTSISVIPPELNPFLEPRTAPNKDRLEAVVMCQESKIPANEAVVQPIMPPYFTDDVMNNLLTDLKKANIKKFKPEFLTLSPKNLAWIGDTVRHIDANMAKELYELYIAPENITNVKHKNRMAPDRDYTRNALIKLKSAADKYGIDMSVCHWVRNELDISQSEIPPLVREIRHKQTWVCKPAGAMIKARSICT